MFKILNKLVYGLLFLSVTIKAQYDPQFTQYMHNTTVVNPAFTGALGQPIITAVERIQWAGLKGAPHTQSLSFHAPMRKNNLGLGMNIINDAIGPLKEIYVDAVASYAVLFSNDTRLAFGLKLGGRYFQVDKEKLILEDMNDVKIQNDINELFVTVGAGLYFNSESYYFGISVPNLIPNRVYSGDIHSGSIIDTSYECFIIGGYAFQINYDTRFKPAMLVKIVEGSPVSIDTSANFLFYERFQLGLSYRLKDSFSITAGFDVTENVFVGYAYDLTSSRLRLATSGSHEIILKYKGNTPRRRFGCEAGGLAWF